MKHMNNAEKQAGNFENLQACINHNHDKNSHGMNPILYRSRAGKIAVTFAIVNAVLFTFTDTVFTFSV